MNTEGIIRNLPIFTAVFGSTVIATLISGYISVITSRKNSRLEHITRDRSKWREEVRKIGDLLYSKDFNDIKKALSKLKLYINAYGMNASGELKNLGYDDYMRDAHIWRLIDILENDIGLWQFNSNDEGDAGESDNSIIFYEVDHMNIESEIDLLIKYLSLLLKFDWERAKMEVELNRRKNIGICMMIMGFFSLVLCVNLNDDHYTQTLIIDAMYTSTAFLYYVTWRRIYLRKLRRNMLVGRKPLWNNISFLKTDFVSKHYFEISLTLRDLGWIIVFGLTPFYFIGLRFKTVDFFNKYVVIAFFLSMVAMILGIVAKNTEEGADLRREVTYITSIKDTTKNRLFVSEKKESKSYYMVRLESAMHRIKRK